MSQGQDLISGARFQVTSRGNKSVKQEDVKFDAPDLPEVRLKVTPLKQTGKWMKHKAESDGEHEQVIYTN